MFSVVLILALIAAVSVLADPEPAGKVVHLDLERREGRLEVGHPPQTIWTDQEMLYPDFYALATTSGSWVVVQFLLQIPRYDGFCCPSSELTDGSA